ncbi:hypothetical protein [Kitasatospora sp. NPDC057541]|uniref:hypothetical protein n=1 Tax=unclassified Kitasatospora TaxID=2633591 RepID=UPI0036B901CE
MSSTPDGNERAIPRFTSHLPGQRRDGTPGAGGARPFGPDPEPATGHDGRRPGPLGTVPRQRPAH